MGVDEPNKLGRVAELVTIGGAFFNLVLVISRDGIYLISIILKGSGGRVNETMLSFLRALAQYRGKCALATRRRSTKVEAW